MVGSLKVIYLLTARDFEHCSPNRPSTPGTKIGSTGCPPIRLWRCKRKKSKVLPPSPVPLLTLTAGNGKFHCAIAQAIDRKSTRLNSSDVATSYADFCL